MEADSTTEMRHKRQQSQDSGTYNDWTQEEPAPKESEYNSNVTGEFVTVVAVEPSEPKEKPFVTVLSVDPADKEYPRWEDVLVYRLPGERLGFGLKFEGGLKNSEKVSRLFIQSCAADSPASRSSASWGPLAPNDEILAIDGAPVSEMTRMDCVRALKESNVVIELRVRRGGGETETECREGGRETRAPPIPPRKFPRKKEAAEPSSAHQEETNSPPVYPRSRLDLPRAEIYTDLISRENLLQPAESESDDTGSSISTVVSRICSTPTTSNSSFSDGRSVTSVESTSPPTPTKNTTAFDLDRVLEPFLQLEREFSSNNLDETSIFSKLVEASNLIDAIPEETTPKPPESFRDNGEAGGEAPRLPPKPLPREETPTAPEKSKFGKRRPPPPPPPRTDRPVCPKPPPSEPVNASATVPAPDTAPVTAPAPAPQLVPEPHHLPRLIDFVPKDRTDVVVPSPMHPDTGHDNLSQQATRTQGSGRETAAPSTSTSELRGTATDEMDSAPRRNERHAADMDPRHGLGRAEKGNYLETQLPPSFSRQPPDGHEFPTHYEETVRDSLSRTDVAPSEQRKKLPPPNAPKCSRTLEETFKRISTSYVDNYKHRGWRNDEKSEKSVKDKIAMFSSANGDNTRTQPTVTRKLNRYKSSDDVNFQNEGAMASIFANSETIKDESAKLNSSKKGSLPYTSLVDVSGSINAQSDSPPPEKTRSTLDLSSTARFPYETGPSHGEYSTLPRNYDAGRKLSREESDLASKSALSRALSFTGTAKIHGRSQSLIDVGSKFDRPTGKSIEDARKSSLNALIEQRRKSMSKLRGLVIPEKVAEGPAPQYILDLPEIKSKDYLVTSGRGSSSGTGTGTVIRGDGVDGLRKMSAPVGALTLPITPWKCDLPKYSPAFKRKSLSIYGTPSSVSSLSSSRSSSREELRNCFESSKHYSGGESTAHLLDYTKDSTKCQTTPQSRPGPEFLESSGSPSISERSFDSGSNNESPNLKIPRDGSTDYKVYEESSIPKINPEVRVTEEESDNDSAVSSSRSSISHGFSPPNSPMPDVQRSDKVNGLLTSSQSNGGERVLKRTLSSETTTSTSSNGSTLTSGSQASCSSLSSSLSADSRRVLKPQSLEAINRKNVLSSARYSSGQDLKVGSPPMQMIRTDCLRTSVEENNTLLKDSTPSCAENEIFPIATKREDFDKAFNSQVSVNTLEKPGDNKDKTIDIDHSSKKLDRDILNDDNVMRFQNDDDLKYCKSKYTDEIGDNILEIRESYRKDLPVSGKFESSWENNNCKRNNNTKYPSTQGGLKIGLSTQVELKQPIPVKSGVSTQKSVSVNDIKIAFEKAEQSSNGRIRTNAVPVLHPRVSSIDSTNSDESLATTPTHYGSASDLLKEQQFGSITSLASSTSLISQQELSQLIEDSNHALEEGGCSQEVEVVILHRDTAGSSVGIILAGGADCEAKDITVHKVLCGSPAEKDGRIQKGDRIISINGKSMKGLSHLDSIAILKAPRPEVVLVVSRYRSDTAEDSTTRIAVPLRQPRIQEHTNPLHPEKAPEGRWGNITTVILAKDGAGLGFSLEGGKDSPFGDQPLTIKKIFTGGCAEKCGQLHAGDELLSVNNTDLSGLSRIEAWALMKRLPDGKVQLNIRHPVT